MVDFVFTWDVEEDKPTNNRVRSLLQYSAFHAINHSAHESLLTDLVGVSIDTKLTGSGGVVAAV